ncbi:MAG: phosphate acyltransferase PlsX [Clostridiales bacterium]|nr:phosphate acyltransferase PlsX [Clostridiales bacterium]
MIKIVVDIQGADSAAPTLIDGVINALEKNAELFVYLCGDKAELEAELSGKRYDTERLQIIDAPQVITNDEKPLAAVMAKKNSSLVKGLELCKSKSDVGAFVTCGATGAMFVAAMMLLEKIVKSPALLCALKKPNGAQFCIVDCGANVDCRPERTEDFARIGVAYMKTVGVQLPRIALLSNGAEDAKGNKFTKQAHDILRASDLNFIGNIEGSDVLSGNADVIVSEGFGGNVLLKTIEGSAKAVVSELKESIKAKMGDYSELDEIVDAVYREYDYTTQGGAMLLGFKTPIVKGHGAATAETVYNIIDIAYSLANNGVMEKIQNEF